MFIAGVHHVLGEQVHYCTFSRTSLQHFEYVCDDRLKRNKPGTWKPELQGTLMLNHGMLSQFHHSGHSQAVWDVRGNPACQAAHNALFPEAEGKLTVSFDGCAFSLPPEQTGIGWHSKDWLHLDQGWGTLPKNRTHGQRRAYQSWVTAYPIEKGDATLQVLVGSHKFHQEFASAFKRTAQRDDWHKLTPEEVEWYKKKGCKQVAIECPAGAQVLWDSRTVHAGRAPVKGRATPRQRIVVYLCFSPRAWLSPDFAQKKINYLAEGRMTSHWPHWPKLFPKTPRTYGKHLNPTPPFRPPKLSINQLLLAGHSKASAEAVVALPRPDPGASNKELHDAEVVQVASTADDAAPLASAVLLEDEARNPKRRKFP